MEVLILVRDLIIAVLLSWAGVDAPEKEDNNQDDTTHFYLSSDEAKCDNEIFAIDA